MKPLYLITMILWTLGHLCIAQNQPENIQIAPVLLQEKADSLLLDMQIHVPATAMTEKQSWIFMPVLISADSIQSLTLPRVLVNGKRKAQLFKQKEKFQNKWLMADYPDIRIDKKPRRDTTIHYVYRAPYELWMDEASLQVNLLLCGCADAGTAFTIPDLARVTLPPYLPYRPSVKVNYLTPEKEVKTLRCEGTAYLDFKVGSSVILPDFRRNPRELAKIEEHLDQVFHDPDFELSTLSITGYASPEGSWKSNDRLSLARSQALWQYLTGKYPALSRMVEVGNVPEDWEGLERLIREGEMESKEKVLQIIETVSDPDTRERQLRTLDGGRPFRYMLEEIFPSLRRVVYRVEFTVKEYSLEESGAIMQKNPEQLNHYELTRLYRSFPEHSAKQEEIGELIITMFPDDPVAASNTIARLIEKDEPEKASAYVESASRLPEAYNTVGAYYLLMENPDEAEEYFHKALEAASREDMPYTIEEVQTHLQEVEKKREDLQIRERYNRRNITIIY
ncbi:MAG: DUF3868 domain-containing protein [Tannerellaceae bacterium]|nr:DUF3868 domain-containing protein [Tannerellaceae bacterium]